MKLPDKIQEHIVTVLVALTVGTLTFFGTQAAHALSTPFWQHIAPAIPLPLLLSLCCLLILIVVLLALWVIYLHRPKDFLDLLKQYERDEPSGAYRHKTKKHLVCTGCLFTEPHQEAPLFQPYPNRGWKCPLCRCHYGEPATTLGDG